MKLDQFAFFNQQPVERQLALGVAPTDLDAEIAPNWSLPGAA
ncbi:MAG: hypothetical protein ACK45B_14160 [Limisphaerales bacterium]|jgi:hypothetical protein